jgi:hypothetical protein
MTCIAIVNRFFPPDTAITGQLACELADFLCKRMPDAKICIVSTGAKYGGGQKKSEEVPHEVRRLRSWYDGKRKLLRLASSLYDGLRLAWIATRNADTVISLTDPPLLGLWVGLLARFRKRRWIEWTMDLYPEAFAAGGLIGRRHPIFKALVAVMRRFPPTYYICLGPRQHAYIQRARGISTPAFILPCGLTKMEPGPAPDWRQKHVGKVIVAYAGNLGEAHSLEVLDQLVRRADRTKIAFLFAPYGSKALALRNRLGSQQGVEWRDRIPSEELAHADVHLTCLAAKWTHLCVPSKAVSAICMGRPVLFAGAFESDTWVLLKDASWLISEAQDGSYTPEEIDRVLTQILDREAREAKTRATRSVRSRLIAERYDTLDALARFLDGPEDSRESANLASAR